ncbi:MAG: endonuclease/exonuclease/phosphatase family protein [Roseovarius sp.]
MKTLVRIMAALALMALGLSFAGALHPVGDSLAVFRLAIVVPALLLVLATGLPRGWRLAGAALCLAGAGSVLWHKLPLAGPGPVTVYQKNMFHRNSDIAGLAQDILAAAPDIVTLQEVSVENEALLDLLWEAYPTQHLCRYTSRSGVAVLTRLPTSGTPFCSEEIGLAVLPVETGAGTVRAMSLHFAWPYPGRQAKQVEWLTRYLGQGAGPAIMGGDFNMVPWSHTLRRIGRAAGFERAGPSRPTFQLGPFPLPIDHVFAPGGGRTEARGLSGSDHRGLVARVSPAR